MISPVFRTVPRALEVTFTKPVGYFGYSAVVRRGDSRFHEIADFNREGVTIAVTQGEAGHEFAKHHLPKAKLIAVPTGDISRPLLEVLNGRADAGIADSWTIKQFAARQSGITDLFAENPFNTVSAGWLLRQGDVDWLAFLNTGIDWLESTGLIDQIETKYQIPSFRERKVWTTSKKIEAPVKTSP